MSVKSFGEGYVNAWVSHDMKKIVSYFTNNCVYEDVAFRVANCGKEEKLQVLIMEFLISLSLCSFASMNAKALTGTTLRACRALTTTFMVR